MYEADGIDLTRSEYEELRNIEKRAGSTPYEPLDESLWTCRALDQARRLVRFNESTMDARLTRRGFDWIASYEHSVKMSHRATFREVLLAAWSVIGGAAAGGFVAYLLFKLYGIG